MVSKSPSSQDLDKNTALSNSRTRASEYVLVVIVDLLHKNMYTYHCKYWVILMSLPDIVTLFHVGKDR